MRHAPAQHPWDGPGADRKPEPFGGLARGPPLAPRNRMAELRPGMVIAGKYRVERALGGGAMGQVVAAVHLVLGEEVAVKVLRAAQDDAGGTARERFLREARALGRLKSEHVAHVMDAGVLDGGIPYVVMERLEGRDLARLLRERGPIPEAEAIDMLLQACSALADAHARGIVHRDLKPANLFLTRRPDGSALLKVLDFGISKLETDVALTQSAATLGSPSYMPPEQVRSARDADARSDVWSLGVVLYELVSGRLPFLGDTFGDLAVRITTEPPQPLQARPPLQAIVRRCLEKRPEARFQSVAELALALAELGPPAWRERAESVARTLSIALSPSLAFASTAGGTTVDRSVGQRARATQETAPRRSRRVVAGAGVALAGLLVWLLAARSGSAPTDAIEVSPAAAPAAPAPLPAAEPPDAGPAPVDPLPPRPPRPGKKKPIHKMPPGGPVGEFDERLK